MIHLQFKKSKNFIIIIILLIIVKFIVKDGKQLKPKISIFLPIYNMQDYINKTLEII